MMDLFLFLGGVVVMILLLILGALLAILGLWGIISVWKAIKEAVMMAPTPMCLLGQMWNKEGEI
jgi:hypothetical protein